MAPPNKDLATYLTFNQELYQQQYWFKLKLKRHLSRKVKQAEIKKWEAVIPASVLNVYTSTPARLQASLAWYSAKPWYSRWWLRRTTNVGWIARYYAYKQGYDVLSNWGEMNESYQRLQTVNKESQRYLPTFSWDRRQLKKPYRKLENHWQKMIFTKQPTEPTQQKPVIKKIDLLKLLQETDKKINQLRLTKTGGFFSFTPTYGELETKAQYANPARCTASRKALAADACQSLNDGWLGRFSTSKQQQAERELVYLSALSHAVRGLLSDMQSSSFNNNDTNPNWTTLEALIIEGVQLGYGQLVTTRQPSRVWSIYNELFIGLSSFAFNPQAAKPPISPWQSMIHKTSAWFYTHLQTLSGNTIPPKSQDHRMHIERYVGLAEAYSNSIKNRAQVEKALAANRLYEPVKVLKKKRLEMENNINVILHDLLVLQQQTAFADIQAQGSSCEQALRQVRSEIEHYDALVEGAKRGVVERSPTTSTTQVRLMLEAPSNMQWPERRPVLVIQEAVGSAANAASAQQLEEENPNVILPEDKKERKAFVADCKKLGITIDSKQKSIRWQEIEKAYRKIAVTNHPDRSKQASFNEMNMARDHLREMYEKQLKQEAAHKYEQLKKEVQELESEIKEIRQNRQKERIRIRRQELAAFLVKNYSDKDTLQKLWQGLELMSISSDCEPEDKEIIPILQQDFILFIEKNKQQIDDAKRVLTTTAIDHLSEETTANISIRVSA